MNLKRGPTKERIERCDRHRMQCNVPRKEEDEGEEQEPAAEALVGLGDGRGERGDATLPPDVGEG